MTSPLAANFHFFDPDSQDIARISPHPEEQDYREAMRAVLAIRVEIMSIPVKFSCPFGAGLQTKAAEAGAKLLTQVSTGVASFAITQPVSKPHQFRLPFRADIAFYYLSPNPVQ